MIYQVLIVDDEEIVCRGMAQFVKWKEHGFEVAAIATSVDEALLILRKMHIDVVFTDIRMPEKSGIDLLREIREQKFDTQCVILSGYSDFDYAKEAMRYGAVEYLTQEHTELVFGGLARSGVSDETGESAGSRTVP